MVIQIMKNILKEYLKNSTLHGAKFITNKEGTFVEKCFWIVSILASWCASFLLISASLGMFH